MNKWAMVACSVLFLFGCKKHYSLLHSKSKWIREYFDEVAQYDDIHALSWWNENFDATFLKINSGKRARNAYREAVASDVYLSECIFSNDKLVPPPQGMKYIAAFPDFGGTEDQVSEAAIQAFEEDSGKPIAWAYFSNNWLDSLVFPKQDVQTILSAGKTPFIRIMFRSEFEEGKKDPSLNLLDVINGTHDAAIAGWANEAKNIHAPLLVEFGTEVNGQWFPWNGIYYGGGEQALYGQADYPDGPEIFRDAYRHLIDLCRAQGANNLTWFFHFDVNDDPEVWWNDPEYYYPGDDYIDWIGVSTYGPMQRGDDYVSPADLIRKAHDRLVRISKDKPYAVLEFGITEL